MRYLMFLFLLISCVDEKKETIERNLIGKELNKNATNINSFNPPANHPVKVELMRVEQKGLVEVDEIYKSSVPSSKNEQYYDNLRQIGFVLLLKNGLIEDGTKDQKLYYVKEQLQSSANLLNVKDFYLLLNSLKPYVPLKELNHYSNQFYSKNLSLINEINWEKEQDKKIEINKLNESLRLFTSS